MVVASNREASEDDGDGNLSLMESIRKQFVIFLHDFRLKSCRSGVGWVKLGESKLC